MSLPRSPPVSCDQVLKASFALRTARSTSSLPAVCNRHNSLPAGKKRIRVGVITGYPLKLYFQIHSNSSLMTPPGYLNEPKLKKKKGPPPPPSSRRARLHYVFVSVFFFFFFFFGGGGGGQGDAIERRKTIFLITVNTKISMFPPVCGSSTGSWLSLFRASTLRPSR